MPGVPVPTRPRPRWPFAALLLLAAAVAACAEPAPPATDAPEGADEPLAARPLDPTREELVAQLGRLGDSVAAARERLELALAADDVAALRAAAGEAVDQLLAAAATTDQEPSPVLPSVSSERSVVDDQADALTATLIAAREAGGSLGRTTLDLLRDPIAGDVGAWERDAPGVVQQIRAAADEGPDPSTAEDAIVAVDGDAPRALAWSLVASTATDTDQGIDAATRALAHLEVVELALSVVAEVAEDGTTSPGTPGVDEPDLDDPDAPAPEQDLDDPDAAPGDPDDPAADGP